MKVKSSIIRMLSYYYQLLYLVAPRVANNYLFSLFTSPRFQKIRDHEKVFLDTKNEYEILVDDHKITYYMWNDTSCETILLLHGWEGNPGSLGLFISMLKQLDFRVIAPNAPGHYTSQNNRCTIRDYQRVIEKFISEFNVKYIISHSFGSAASALAIQNSVNSRIKKFISISSPNQMKDLILNFVQLLNLTISQENIFLEFVERKLDLTFDQAVISKMLLNKHLQILFIHDKNDYLIPVENAMQLSKTLKNSQLLLSENKGHYRILWDEKIVKQSVEFLLINSLEKPKNHEKNL